MKRSSTPQEIESLLQRGLREKGYKLTPQRRAILTVLSRDMTHPGASDIWRKVRTIAPRVSISTVYYTLEVLKNEGLIQELEFYDRDNRYDVNVSNHINLICRKCGTIEDFPGEPPYSAEEVRKKTGFQPMQMRFEYYGYCKDCRRVKQR